MISPRIRPLVALVGPTATGKSDLALDLAERLDGEIVNSDASQFYRGMDIGTAKLPLADRRGIPHHQIDTLDIRDEATIARYQREARRDIDAVIARGRTPIVVGGSGLYVRAALDVLDIPPTDPEVRAHFEARLEAEGSGVLHRELAQADPKAAADILASNARRVVRALEVIALTGRPFSASAPTKTFLRPTLMIGLHAEPAVLVERIERRVELMWQAGLLDEVRALDARGLRQGRTASRAIGYAQALAQLDGQLDERRAKETTAIATRQFARRQRAWFRPDPRPVWLPFHAPDLLDRALAEIDAYDPRRHGEVAATAEQDHRGTRKVTGAAGTVWHDAAVTRIHFTKGHGTQNDFVLVPDADSSLDLSPTQVAYVCDRRSGLGGDGLIRVVRTANAPEVAHLAGQAEWFMDYRNADGSLAEMCGNGTRVFAEYLRAHDLVSEDEFTIATRAGVKKLVAVPHGWAVDLGQWRLARAEEAERRGMDSVVQVREKSGAPVDAFPALSLDLGNPHTVVALPPSVRLGALDLDDAPRVDPHPEHGTNVEFVRAIEAAHISMRVHERGSGETRSCGTGAAAAALATWWWAGQPAGQLDWRVDVPGGTLGVHIKGDEVALSGPGVLVADGELELPEL